MKHFLLIVGCLCAASSAIAQSANPFMSELKQFYTVRKGDLLKAADRMPAADYDFKPTPDVRTFGQLIAHIADAQMSFCSGAKGKPIRLNAASKTSKADLVAALKASFDEHFAGRTADLFKLLFFASKVNFADFFSAWESVAREMSAKANASPPPQASSGSSGESSSPTISASH